MKELDGFNTIVDDLRLYRDKLHDFDREIQRMMCDLQDEVNNLVKEGAIPDEAMEKYLKSFYAPLENEVKSVVTKNVWNNIEYIDRLIDFVRPDIFIDEKRKLY